MDKTPGIAGRPELLTVRVQLVDSAPEIWRLLELAGHLTLGSVHEVLQAAFGWENAHLHRFTATDPFTPLQQAERDLTELPQWLPAHDCEGPGDMFEDGCSLNQLLVLAPVKRSTNTTLVIAGSIGSSWFPAGHG